MFIDSNPTALRARVSRHWRIAAFAGLAALSVLAGGCSFSINTDEKTPAKIELKPGDPAEQRAAATAAKEIVLLLDTGRPEATWAKAGRYVRDSMSEGQFVGTLRGLRGTVGGMKSRKVLGGGFTPTLEAGVPAGHYCMIFYSTEFERATVEEKVVLNLEDGQWRLVGYWLNKKFQFGN